MASARILGMYAKKICKWKYSRRSLGFPDKASVQRSLSTSSGSASQSLNMAEKVGITSIFTFAIYNFYQFVTDYPLALQVAIETAKDSDELKAALGGGKITSPFHKRIFWGGNVSAKTGKIQIDVPVVSTKSGKEATIKGKGLQDVYGKNEVWYYSLYAELHEGGEKIDLIVLSEEEKNEGKVEAVTLKTAVSMDKRTREV